MAIAFVFPCFHTGFCRGRAPNVGKCDIFMKEVQPRPDNHEKVEIKENALFLSGVILISCIDVAVISLTLSLSLMLRLTVSRPVYLGIKHPSEAYDQIFIAVRELRVC
jgi:hypothetical protein